MIKYQISTAYKNYLHKVENSLNISGTLLCRKKTDTRIPGCVNFNNFVFNTPQGIVDSCSAYFSSVYVTTCPRCISECKNNCNVPNVAINNITEEDVSNIIDKLKPKNTAGSDQIPSFVIKECTYLEDS